MLDPQLLPDWNSDDTASLRNFLSTTAGSKLLNQLASLVPPLLEKGHVNAVLVRSGVVLGSQNTLRNLVSLAYPPPSPEPQKSEYPALDDDDAWGDGQKIKT